MLGKDSGYVKIGDFGVDRGAPTVAVSGGLRNGASDGYGLTINATDGDPASASSARSGVKRVNLIVDPGTANERVLFSRTQACSDPRASCPLAPENKTFNLTDAPVTAGLHEFRLTVSDAAGNATTETWTKTIRATPSIAASGDGFDAGKTLISARPHLSSVIKPGLYPITEATVTVDGVVVDRQTSTDLQGAAVCDSDGACTIEQDWDPNLASVSAGSHQLMVTAKDSAGAIVSKSATVTIDSTAPTLTVSGVLVDRDGLQLNASSAAVDIAVSDATSPAQQAGIARVAVTVTRGPDTPVASETLLAPSCSPACPADSQASWTYSTATWGSGPATVAVVVRDRAGNETSRSIAVNTPPYEPDAACQTRAAQLVPTGTSVSGSAAATNAENVLPSLTDPVTGIELVQRGAADPLESAPGAVRRLPLHVEGGSSDTAMAERVSEGVTLNQSACLVPSKSTTAATPAVLVDDSAAVFANTNTDTDTVVKATSDGAAIVELARGNGAPDEFSYEVDLRPGLQVVELANDGVAIIDPTAQPDQGTPPSVSPGARENLGEVLTDAELQQDIGESELASAESELGVDVVSVLEAPIAYSETASTSLTDASENTAANGRKGKIHKVGPAKIKVTVPPPPPTPVKKQAVVVLTHNDFDKVDCERGSSPCGDFHVGPAVDYAMTYGPEDRPQSRFYDYESNDCTNFMSQILFMGGGMKWMGEYGGTSGAWYARGNPLGSPGAAPDGRYLTTHTWTVADDMARHMYKYGLLRVVPNATQNDFRRGDLIIMNWWEGSNHSRDDHYDHFQFVTNSGEGSRDPAMAQHSSNDYAAFTWTTVKQRIRNAGHGVVGNGWSFKVLRPVNTGANIDAVVRSGGDL